MLLRTCAGTSPARLSHTAVGSLTPMRRIFPAGQRSIFHAMHASYMGTPTSAIAEATNIAGSTAAQSRTLPIWRTPLALHASIDDLESIDAP